MVSHPKTSKQIRRRKRKMLLLVVCILLSLLLVSGLVKYITGINTKKSSQNQLSAQPTIAPVTTKTPTVMVTETDQVSSVNVHVANEQIVACYPKKKTLIPNNSILHEVGTDRLFVNLPKDIYPQSDIDSFFYTVSGDAKADYMPNVGYRGESIDASPSCWSTYYDFEGSGEVDLRVKSAVKDMPDYFVRFIVTPPK